MNKQPIKMGIHLKCQSMERSLTFYHKLCFQPIFAYGPPTFTNQFTCPTVQENYCGVTFEIGGGLFEIADGHIAVKPEVFTSEIVSSKVSAMIDISSVQEFVEHCERVGIAILVPPRVYPWGTTEVVLRDPDGFILVFRENKNA